MAKTATFKVYSGSAWEELTFTPSSHTHTIANITGLQSKINDYDERISYYDNTINQIYYSNEEYDEKINTLSERISSLEKTSVSDTNWVKCTESFTVNSDSTYYVKIEGSVPTSGIQIATGDLPLYIFPQDADGNDIKVISFAPSVNDMFGQLYEVEGETDIYYFNFIDAMNGAPSTPITTNTAYLVERGSSSGDSVDLSGYLPLTGTTTSNPITGNLHFTTVHGVCYGQPYQGPDGDIFMGFGFAEDGNPVINNPDGRYFGIATEGFIGDPYWYTFPETTGTVVLEETATNHHKFKLLGTKTLYASGYMDLSTTNWANYNELMVIVRATAAATIGIDDATTASSSGFGASKAVSGTSYTKITINKTSDDYYAWDVGGSLLWTNSTSYKYIRAYTTASSISVTIKVYGR